MGPVGILYRWIAPIFLALVSVGLLSLGIYRINRFGADDTLIKLVLVSSASVVLSVVVFVIAQVIHRRALRHIMDEADRYDRD